jgi:putative tryptophan/tyrosine transport system substrate-binding protein
VCALITRRQFVVGVGAAGLGLAAGCGRLPWQAEAPARVPQIGVLSLESADPSDTDNAAFRQGLRDLGYAEGQNIALEWRAPNGRGDQYPALAADLVGRPVDVIVAQGTSPVLAAKQATTTIPVVMANSSDPVQLGLVASLARPGGNVTGLASLSGQLGAKRLELLRDAVPSLARVAMLWNPEIGAGAFEEMAGAAQALGLGLQSVELRRGDDLDAAFQGILQGRADALFVQGNRVTNGYIPEIGEFATAHRLPTMVNRREFVAAGCLMSYGADLPALNRRAAYYVDRILKGAKPADLPVMQASKFELVINAQTARMLVLAVPATLLSIADEVIE